MGTNEKCFVCKNKIQTFNTLTKNIKQQQECKRFYSLVCRYLNIVDDNGIDKSLHPSSSDSKKTLSPSESMLQQEDEPISCCDICIPLIKSFCDTYNNWKILQLVLNWKLETITKLMLMKSKFNQSDKLGHKPGFEIFRKTFLTAATDKSRDFPRLNIPKVKVPRSFQNDHDRVISQDSLEESSGVESPENSDFESGSDVVEDVHDSDLRNRKINRNDATTDKSVVYCCRICRKDFKSKSICISHEQNHSGVKPYKCRYNCGKRFSRKFNCNKHEISMHKIDLAKYQCRFCAKKYAEKSNLIRHERTHTGQQPYSCRHCGKKYYRLYSKQRHELIHQNQKRETNGQKRVNSNNKILTKFKQEFEVDQPNNDASPNLDLEDDPIGNGNSGDFHNNREEILVSIVKSENKNLESY